ncbi:MAG: hypothetical protein AVDCRST_MAG93-7232 [uncultured Chloroflexia bacterium]|uniref:Uncharacterized protein n=1 Tax=uncultured Chloroflexia bacterium TaxID=1672391 RepID=A0A6J4MBI6_9CHLR|nr:MAG: hypothetical protein AVDCRST_MAG93-7232 [uncultured Chloroflexia bacterium]
MGVSRLLNTVKSVTPQVEAMLANIEHGVQRKYVLGVL